jgi:2'-5' RNA ligase
MTEKDGNWSVCITLRIRFTRRILDAIDDLNAHLSNKLSAVQWVKVDCDTYHVSLNRFASVRMFEIESIKEQLKGVCERKRVFDVAFDGLQVLMNQDQSRAFLCVLCAKGKLQICRLVKDIDSVLEEHGLPKFYQVPIPHVSLFYKEASCDDEISASDLWDEFDSVGKDYLCKSECQAIGLDCKFGNKLYSFDFKQ